MTKTATTSIAFRTAAAHDLALAGKSVQEIAVALGVSTTSVYGYLKRSRPTTVPGTVEVIAPVVELAVCYHGKHCGATSAAPCSAIPRHRAEVVTAAKQENAAHKAWEQAGRKGPEPATPNLDFLKVTPATKSKGGTKTASASAAGHASCPECGFTFPKPQPKCRAKAACDKRAQARTSA